MTKLKDLVSWPPSSWSSTDDLSNLLSASVQRVAPTVFLAFTVTNDKGTSYSVVLEVKEASKLEAISRALTSSIGQKLEEAGELLIDEP